MKTTLLSIAFILTAFTFCNAQASLLATATTGGAYGYGTILKGDSTGHNFTVVHNFAITDSFTPNGSYPVGKMAVADNGIIYCITELGGYGDSCTICTLNPITGDFNMIYQFYETQQFGAVPVAGIIKASNGLLYGGTPNGGANYAGVIYSVDPATNTYTDVFDFPTNMTNTSVGLLSELLQAEDGNLYGIVSVGPDSGSDGVLFSFNPVNRQYTPLANLGIINISSDLRTPPLVQGPNHKIYGVFQTESYVGLMGSAGILFSYDLSNNQMTNLHIFSDTSGLPSGGLFIANGNVYGETNGTTYYNSNQAEFFNNGQIYSYNIAANTFTTLAWLDSATGVCPVGGLGMLGNDRLTGSFAYGGANNQGALFTFNLANNTFTTLLDFDSATTGANPQCDIVEANFTATGIAPVTALVPMVYPNPCTGALYIQNAQPNTPYSITNTLGQVVDRGILNSSTQQIDISALAAGMYLINNVKFIKQ